MIETRTLPPYAGSMAGTMIHVTGAAGRQRRDLLDDWASEASRRSVEVRRASGDLARGGIWAGLADLFLAVLPELSRTVPQAVDHHSYELSAVLPMRRHELPERHLPLTETVAADEKVRNYPMDRAFRVLHGLIDLLHTWRAHGGNRPWVVVCDDFDRTGHLVSRFYRELMRRIGGETRLTLVLAGRPGTEDAWASWFDPTLPRIAVALELEPFEDRVAPEEMTRRARKLEAELGSDLVELEIHLPRLIDLWSRSTEPENAMRWKAMAFAIYNHYGFYEDALIYGEEILPWVDRVCAVDSRFSRWQLVGSLYNSYVSVGRIEDAHRVMRDEALDKVEDPGARSRALYLMSMLHARFLPEHDLDAAERYIDEALAALEASDEPPSDRHFFSVFLRNGLALIRHRQGRPEEAIELCQRGFEHLDEHLSPQEHRLHRSVLLYNIGQVYASMGQLERAIESYTRTLEIDPNYSEYYNDRGSLYLKAGDPEAAVRDFQRAIELSPPYHEVQTNLGQALRALGKAEEAVAAFTRSLDLVPGQPLALTGRAQVLENLGRPAEAADDYAAALALDPHQPLVWASLASLEFDANHLDRAHHALDRAIELAPELGDLYFNRAMVHEACGAPADAAADLERYLALEPEAPERTEVVARLGRLTAA